MGVYVCTMCGLGISLFHATWMQEMSCVVFLNQTVSGSQSPLTGVDGCVGFYCLRAMQESGVFIGPEDFRK